MVPQMKTSCPQAVWWGYYRGIGGNTLPHLLPMRYIHLVYIQHVKPVYIIATVHISLCQDMGHFGNSLIAFYMHFKTVGRIFVLIVSKLGMIKIGL